MNAINYGNTHKINTTTIEKLWKRLHKIYKSTSNLNYSTLEKLKFTIIKRLLQLNTCETYTR